MYMRIYKICVYIHIYVYMFGHMYMLGLYIYMCVYVCEISSFEFIGALNHRTASIAITV